LVDFTFNPSLPNQTSSPGAYADTTTQQQLSIPQQDKAGSNLNPQNNGVYPTEVTNQTKNPIGGDEELVVKVKPNIGIWKINSQPTMSYSVYTVSVGANNSIVKQERKTTKTPVSIVGFVSEDQQTFTCTRQKLIEEEFEDVLELYKNFDLRIETQIILSVVPEDKEKNPKDVTAPQTFVINVPPTTTEGLGRLTLVSDTNTERLPKFDGNSYYNIVKPNGGYYTYQFTPTDEIFVPNFETSTSPPIVNRIRTKIFKFPQLNETSFIIRRNSDTKYTNLIEVSDLGEFQLSITYTQSNIPNTTLTVTSNTFTL
jgi:hypothetical protein